MKTFFSKSPFSIDLVSQNYDFEKFWLSENSQICQKRTSVVVCECPSSEKLISYVHYSGEIKVCNFCIFEIAYL